MKTTVSNCDFHDAFRAYDRLANFSYEGRNLLFEFLEQMEDDSGYSIDLSECEDEEERKDSVLEYLNDNTMVVGETDTGIVYQAF